MAFKDILVLVDQAAPSIDRLRIAADLAQHYAAHLIGVYVVPSNTHAYDGFVRGEAIRALGERRRKEEERSVLEVGRQFAELTRRNDIHAEFRLILNSDGDQNVILNSLYADLVIVGQTESHGLPPRRRRRGQSRSSPIGASSASACGMITISVASLKRHQFQSF